MYISRKGVFKMPTQAPNQVHPIEQQTTLVAKVAEKKNVFEPWKSVPTTCYHCGKVFNSNTAKNSHLQHCRHRFLNRYYKLGTQSGNSYLFVLQLNPLRRRRNALQKLISDFHDPKMLLGAVAYLMNDGIIRNYSALPLVDSIKMIQYPDGRVLFNMIKKLLTEKELRLLEAQVSTLNDEKDKLREAAGIKI